MVRAVQSDAQATPRPLVLVDGLTREQILAAVGDARDSGGPLDLEGHGSSGVAALSLAVHQRRLGLEIDHVACLDARDGEDPVSGQALVVPPRPAQVTTRITLLAGRDEASIAWTDQTVAAFRAAGWDVSGG
jgi:hypothetical protein